MKSPALFLISFVLLLALGAFSHTAEGGETAYDRVMRTNTLRCGYWIMPPTSLRDPNTGELKGGSVVLFNDIAQRLSLKVAWVEEVNFATMMTGLEAGRYDAICTGVFLAAARVRAMEYTSPFMFSSVIPVVRRDDTRFDADLNSLNSADVRIAVHDSLSVALAARLFPHARRVELPEIADPQQLLLEVGAGKADAAFYDLVSFRTGAPGAEKLKVLHADNPLAVFPWVIAVRKGEHSLASLLNGALEEMIYNNEIAPLMQRSGVPPKSFRYPHPQLELE